MYQRVNELELVGFALTEDKGGDLESIIAGLELNTFSIEQRTLKGKDCGTEGAFPKETEDTQ